MVQNVPPRMPRFVSPCPLLGAQSLLAEQASFRMHLSIRGREFADAAELQSFVRSLPTGLDDPLPAHATDQDRAQDFFYRARDARTRPEGLLLIDEALALDPHNADALVENAFYDMSDGRRVELLERAVEIAHGRFPTNEELEEHDGESWGLLHARPALRARAALAAELVYTGRLDDALEQCERLLQLDAADAIGAGYWTFALLLETGRVGRARRFFAAREDSDSAVFAWGAVLLAHLTGDDALSALSRARRLCPMAEDFLIAPDLLDPLPPETYESGSEQEAEIAGHLLWRAWHKRPDALAWLRERARDVDLRPAMDVPIWELILEGDEDGVRPGLLPFLAPADPQVVARLRELLDVDATRGRVHMAEGAAWLLGRLGAGAAAEDLVTHLRLRACEADTLACAAISALAELRAAAVDPVLAAYAVEADRFNRIDLVSILSRCGVRDDRIRAVLLAELDEDLEMGAPPLADYGDPSVLPLLSEHLDGLRGGDAGPGSRAAAEIIDAIQRLGGELSAGQRLRFAGQITAIARWNSPEGRRETFEMMSRFPDRPRLPGPPRRTRSMDPGRDDFEEFDDDDDELDDYRPHVHGEDCDHDHDDPEPAGAPLRADSTRPGRNEPCWCGSGRKYKRCHLAEDEA